MPPKADRGLTGAIVCQLKLKEEAGLELLHDCIMPSMGEQEFFLQKAIGWALREYAKTDREEVIRFVRTYESALSGLSKREALKNAHRQNSGRRQKRVLK